MDLIKIFFELIRPVEMPWQIVIFIFVGSIVVYWVIRLGSIVVVWLGKAGMGIIEGLYKLLLLPEHLITSLFRKIKLDSITNSGADTYGEFVAMLCKAIYNLFQKLSTFRGSNIGFPMRWVVLSMILVVVVWFMRLNPDYRNTVFLKYVNSGFNLYLKLQSKVLSH